MGDFPVLLTAPKEDGSVAKREDIARQKGTICLPQTFRSRVEVTLACCTGRQKKVVAFPIHFFLSRGCKRGLSRGASFITIQ